MTFCEVVCPFFPQCEIKDARGVNGKIIKPIEYIRFKMAMGRAPRNYWQACRYTVCNDGEIVAQNAIRRDKSGAEWVIFKSDEKGDRWVNRRTGEIGIMMNDIMKITGQIIKLSE